MALYGSTPPRAETREERDARLLRQSDEAEAGAFDHIFERQHDYLLSQLPDGYAFDDDAGCVVRTDLTLPEDVWIASGYDGVPTDRKVKITAL